MRHSFLFSLSATPVVVVEASASIAHTGRQWLHIMSKKKNSYPEHKVIVVGAGGAGKSALTQMVGCGRKMPI